MDELINAYLFFILILLKHAELFEPAFLKSCNVKVIGSDGP